MAFVDLGSAALIIPGGLDAAKAELRRVLAAGAYERGLGEIGDPELADQ